MHRSWGYLHPHFNSYLAPLSQRAVCCLHSASICLGLPLPHTSTLPLSVLKVVIIVLSSFSFQNTVAIISSSVLFGHSSLCLNKCYFALLLEKLEKGVEINAWGFLIDFLKYLFIWLCRGLVMLCGIFCYSLWTL